MKIVGREHNYIGNGKVKTDMENLSSYVIFTDVTASFPICFSLQVLLVNPILRLLLVGSFHGHFLSCNLSSILQLQ